MAMLVFRVKSKMSACEWYLELSDDFNDSTFDYHMYLDLKTCALHVRVPVLDFGLL